MLGERLSLSLSKNRIYDCLRISNALDPRKNRDYYSQKVVSIRKSQIRYCLLSGVGIMVY